MSKKVESKLDRELHHATAIGSSKLVQKILDSGKVHVDCQDEEGISPLMLATANNRLNCVKILLQEGADPQLKSKDGTCAVFLAARCGYSQVLALLLENNSQKASHLTEHGASKGAKMCQIEDCAICKAGQIFLQENGIADKNTFEENGVKNCTTSKENGESLGNHFFPPCTIPTENGRTEEDHASPLCTISKENGGSIENNVSPLCTEKLTSGQQRQPHLSSLARKDGITPLIMAAAMNHDECVDLLLSAGVDPNEESKIGSTALFHACLRGHVKAAKRLICDPRINLRVLRNGETCLHAAAISGNPELVQMLLEKSKDPMLTNAGGQSPLDLLIMFINYGNISLTSNLLKVLNLLPTSTTDATAVSSSPVKETKNNSRKEVPSPISNISQEEMQKLRKLVRIYCPFNFNHATKEMIACSTKSNKSQPSMKKSQGGSLPASVMSRSLNSSPNKNGKSNNHHVRFTPDLEKKASDMDHSESPDIHGNNHPPRKASSLFWIPPQRIQRAQCKILTTDELMKTLKKAPTKVFLSKLNGESEIRNH